jgi:hypothetical protein
LLAVLRLHPFGRATLAAMALSAVCFGLLPAGARLLLPGEPLVAAGAVLVGAVGFAVVCLRFRAALALPPLRALRPRPRRPLRPAAAPPDTGTAEPAPSRVVPGGAQ